MRRWWLLALVACSAICFAQQPEGPGQAVETETPAIATDAPPAADAEAAPQADPEVADAGPDGEGSPEDEFTPDEEITEDYAVPLPSDI